MAKTSAKTGARKAVSARRSIKPTRRKVSLSSGLAESVKKLELGQGQPNGISEALLGRVHCVGGTVRRNWTAKWKVLGPLSKAIAENHREGTNFYLFLTSESLDKSTHSNFILRDGDENVPVLNLVSSFVPPTEYVARHSLQLQQDKMFAMSEVCLKWEETSHPGFNILKSARPGNGEWTENEHLLLPLHRPSKILNKKPDKVMTVSIKYKGMDIVCDCDRRDSIARDVEDLIEDGEVNASDRNELIALLEKQKSTDENSNREAVESEKEQFRRMVDSLSRDNMDVLRKLEEMKVFKIYPSNLPKPTTNWTGIETGFRKDPFVNIYIGKADGIY